jgi:hypothetical protein
MNCSPRHAKRIVRLFHPVADHSLTSICFCMKVYILAWDRKSEILGLLAAFASAPGSSDLHSFLLSVSRRAVLVGAPNIYMIVTFINYSNLSCLSFKFDASKRE